MRGIKRTVTERVEQWRGRGCAKKGCCSCCVLLFFAFIEELLLEDSRQKAAAQRKRKVVAAIAAFIEGMWERGEQWRPGKRGGNTAER